MAAGAQQTDFGPKTEANLYMRKAWRKEKSLKNASAQRIGSDMMVVLQHMVKSMTGAKHQTTTCLQAISAQQTDHGLMAVLQRTTMPRVVTSW